MTDLTTAPVYEQAFAAGLDGDELRQGLVQYGSTLRNLERFGDAVQALQQADEQFPGQASAETSRVSASRTCIQ